jgi:hypothetical protein
MKVTFKYGISGFTGKVDGNSIYFHKEARRFVVRRIRKYVELPQDTEFRSVQKNLWRIHPAEAYKNDLRQYIAAYKKLPYKNRPNFITWNNVWQALMYELQRLVPGIDLRTLTRQDIYDQNLPCINVAAAVNANLLYPVPGWETLVNTI